MQKTLYLLVLSLGLGLGTVAQASEIDLELGSRLPEPRFGDAWMESLGILPRHQDPHGYPSPLEPGVSFEDWPVPLEPQGIETLPRVEVSQSPPTPPDSPTDRLRALGLNYRVLADAATETIQERVKGVVPGAFRTQVQGELRMQAGAFPTLEQAQRIQRQLREEGLEAWIEVLSDPEPFDSTVEP
jgi:hypothetical protein